MPPDEIKRRHNDDLDWKYNISTVQLHIVADDRSEFADADDRETPERRDDVTETIENDGSNPDLTVADTEFGQSSIIAHESVVNSKNYNTSGDDGDGRHNCSDQNEVDSRAHVGLSYLGRM